MVRPRREIRRTLVPQRSKEKHRPRAQGNESKTLLFVNKKKQKNLVLSEAKDPRFFLLHPLRIFSPLALGRGEPEGGSSPAPHEQTVT